MLQFQHEPLKWLGKLHDYVYYKKFRLAPAKKYIIITTDWESSLTYDKDDRGQ